MQHVAPVRMPQLQVGATFVRDSRKNPKTGEDEEIWRSERKIFKGHYLTWLILTAIFIGLNVFITAYAIPLMNEATELIRKADKALLIVENDIQPLIKTAHDLLEVEIKPMVQDGRNIIAQADAVVTEVRAQNQELMSVEGNLHLKPGDTCRYANDNVCDEPMFCEPGTDVTDCANAVVP